jgi:hypothetical protein
VTSTSRGTKVLVEYLSRNRGKHFVNGFSTKEQYGYRSGGEVFEVYEADVRARPDLFRPIAGAAPRGVTIKDEKLNRRQPTVPTPLPPPAPEPVAEKREKWRMEHLDHMPELFPGINARHFNILTSANISTFGDLSAYSKEELMAIKGIGEKTADALLAGLAEVTG